MLTLYDVLSIVDDDVKRKKWLLKYGILRSTPPGGHICPDCGAKMKVATHRGKAGFRCTARPCGKRLSSVSGGLLEGFHLSEKEFLLLAFLWAHDCAGVRAEEMLGHASETVAEWSARFRQCVLNQQDLSKDLFILLCEHIRDGFFQ